MRNFFTLCRDRLKHFHEKLWKMSSTRRRKFARKVGTNLSLTGSKETWIECSKTLFSLCFAFQLYIHKSWNFSFKLFNIKSRIKRTTNFITGMNEKSNNDVWIFARGLTRESFYIFFSTKVNPHSLIPATHEYTWECAVFSSLKRMREGCKSSHVSLVTKEKERGVRKKEKVVWFFTTWSTIYNVW